MTIATENGAAKVGRDGPAVREPRVRTEPGYESDEDTPHRVSVGPCHVLISTAQSAMRDSEIDRSWLLDLRNNIRAAAAYIASQEPLTRFDPVLVAAAYNSGGIYDASDPDSRYHSPWHIRAWPGHLDRACAWYGDAVATLSGEERAA